MTTFKATIATDNFPTSEQRPDTTKVTGQEKQQKKQCDEFIFCHMADHCDGFNCLNKDSSR